MLQGIRPAFKFNVVIVSIYLIKRGENMFKKIIASALATLMLLIVLPTKVNASEIDYPEEPMKAEYAVIEYYNTIYVPNGYFTVGGTISRSGGKIVGENLRIIDSKGVIISSFRTQIVGNNIQYFVTTTTIGSTTGFLL